MEVLFFMWGMALTVVPGMHSGELSKSEWFVRGIFMLMGMILWGYGIHLLRN